MVDPIFVVAEIRPLWWLYAVLSTVFVLLLIVLFIHQYLRLVPTLPRAYVPSTIILLSLYPVLAMFYHISMLLPSTHSLMFSLSTLYQTFGSVAFVHLLAQYIDPEDVVQFGIQVPLPCCISCCCCCCCSRLPMSR